MIRFKLCRAMFPAKTLLLACVFTAAMPLIVCCQQKGKARQDATATAPAAAAPDTLAGYPAQKFFNEKDSDPQAIEIANKVVENMGGYRAWHDTRYVAWSYYGQYQIWDKHESMFRHEQGKTVVIMNLKKPEGRVFINGIEHNDSLEVKAVLDRTYIFWANNTYWLALPFKLKDSGVTLKYKGEGRTLQGAPADILTLTFKEVGITPDNKHEVYVDKQSGLITQWAFFGSAQDEQPSFIRRFDDYKEYNGLKLSTNRDSQTDKLSITDLVLTNKIPDGVFYSPTPVAKITR